MTILMNGLGYETLCSDRPELIKLEFPGEIEDYVNNQNYLTSLTSIIQVGIYVRHRRHHRTKICHPIGANHTKLTFSVRSLLVLLISKRLWKHRVWWVGYF